MMYFAAIFLVFVAMGIVFVLIRLIASLAILVVGIGAVILVAIGISQGSINSWEELVIASLVIGGAAGLLCCPLLPFVMTEDEG